MTDIAKLIKATELLERAIKNAGFAENLGSAYKGSGKPTKLEEIAEEAAAEGETLEHELAEMAGEIPEENEEVVLEDVPSEVVTASSVTYLVRTAKSLQRRYFGSRGVE